MAIVATNPFYLKSTELNSPPRNAAAITPSNTDELPIVARWLIAATDGTVTLVLEKDVNPVTITVKAGQLYNICYKQVVAAGATGLVAMW